ncbi:MAG TPA: hypothetical protein PK876_01770 [Elusimicrobiota bacterium]|nr:hypothetical protein [Elusimicrobiota bacterium]
MIPSLRQLFLRLETLLQPGRVLSGLSLFFLRLSLALLSSVLVFLSCEIFLMTHRSPFIRDILREWTYNTFTGKCIAYCSLHKISAGTKPHCCYLADYPNFHMRFRTGTLRLPSCEHGYRLNGIGDRDPVYGVVLGDSHSISIRLDDEEVWASRLSQLSGKRFVNFAWGGTGTADHRELAEAVIPALKPPLLLLQLTDNDIKDDFRVYFNTETYPSVIPTGIRPELENFQRSNLDRILHLARRNGTRLVVVFPPEHLRGWADTNGIPFITLGDMPPFQHGDAGMRFTVDSHFNERGNRHIAQELHSFLQKIGLLPPGEPGRLRPPLVLLNDGSGRSVGRLKESLLSDPVTFIREDSVFLFCLRRWGIPLLRGHRDRPRHRRTHPAF